MAKLAVVIGATGTQGAGAVRAFLAAGYTVRAVTRNPASDKAVALKKQGCEVVKADLDSLDELTAAFDGAHAIFALTNFVELIFTLGDSFEAGDREAVHGWNLALAASKQLATLEHYFWSTLPDAKGISGGKYPIPHFDYKASIDARIRAELPALAAVTTYVWLAVYAQNFAYAPFFKPTVIPGSDKRVLLMPSPITGAFPIVGDVADQLSVFLTAALKQPEKIKGKYIDVKGEVITLAQLVDILNEVTKQNAIYVEVPVETFTSLWGLLGREMGYQFEFGAYHLNWSQGKEGEVLQAQDIGVPKSAVVSAKDALAAIKDGLLTVSDSWA